VELRGRASVLQEIGGRQAEPADGVTVPWPRRVSQGGGTHVEDQTRTSVPARRSRVGLRGAS